MAEQVVMVCKDGPFSGLSFTVPDKEVVEYPVIKGSTVVVYVEDLRNGSVAEVKESSA